MYNVCYVKNIDSVNHTWVGQLFTPGFEYQIQDFERIRWSTDDDVIADITSDLLQVGNGTSYITGYSDQIDWLKSKKVSVEELGKKGVLDIPEVFVHKPEGNAYAFVSHDVCDRCTWFGDSVRVEGETLTLDTGDTYASVHAYWIDLSHGRKYQENLISSSYLPKVYDNGTELTEDVDYTINYEDGKVTFVSTPTGPVTADYSYENGSTFYVLPAANGNKLIEHTELQCSVDVNITTAIEFQVWVYNPYDLPNKFQYETISYKNAKDYINGSNLGQGFIRAFGGPTRGIDSDVMVFPFNYAAMSPVNASTGTEIRVVMKDHIPFESLDPNKKVFGTVTFYLLEE